MKRVIIINLDGKVIMSIDCDEYQYGDSQDLHDDEGKELFLYKNDIIQGIIPYRKFIIQFIYE